MPDSQLPSPAAHLADRFAADARALRARATSMAAAAKQGGARGGGRAAGPDAAACRAMASACDQVHQLFDAAARDATREGADAVRAVLPTLAGLVAGARRDAERNVYAGAVTRAHEVIAASAGPAADAPDDADAFDDDELDDDLDDELDDEPEADDPAGAPEGPR